MSSEKSEALSTDKEAFCMALYNPVVMQVVLCVAS